MFELEIVQNGANTGNIRFNGYYIGTVTNDEETRWFKWFEVIDHFEGDFLGWFKTIEECEKAFADALIKRYRNAIESKNKPYEL